MAATDAKRGGEKGGSGGPVPMVSLETALSGAIGSRVRITTSAPTSSTIEGTLFTSCLITNVLAINTSPSTTPTSINGNYKIIPISRIQSFQILSLPSSENTNKNPSFTDALPALSALDLRALRAREHNAISKLHEAEQRKGKGVSKEAQDIFDAFARTMPVRWEGTSIVVSDAVVIAKPYGTSECKLVSGVENSAALLRVQKVLDMEKKKIELRNESAKFKVAVPAAAQRKGG